MDPFNGSDIVFVTMALHDAAEKYRESAERLRRLEVIPGQFANAIHGQVEMERVFLELLDKAQAQAALVTEPPAVLAR